MTTDAQRGDSGAQSGHFERVFEPGTVLNGTVLTDGDCPLNDTDPNDLNPDDGGPEGSIYCGFADRGAQCVALAAYTAWLCGVAYFDREHPERGTPYALCPGHAAVVRSWVELMQMHNVRPAGTSADFDGWMDR